MLVFGIDVPLVEIVLTISIVMVLLLIEAIVLVALLMKNLQNTKKINALANQLAQSLLEVKKKR